MTALRTTWPRRVVAAVPVALVAVAMLAPTARAEVGIAGTVRNATTAEPAGGVPVRIVYFDDQGQVGTDRATTDAEGAFSVVPPAAATGYQTVVEHDGAEFAGVATQLLDGQPSVTTIDVFDTTDEPKDVAVTDWVVWIDTDPESGKWAVQQDFGWTNAGDTAYIGAGGTVTVPMPTGAGNIQFLGTFLEQQGDVADGAYVSTAPIVPGDTSATIRYVDDALPALTLPVTFTVRSFSLYVPMGVQAQGTGLRLAGTQSDQGVSYQVYTADRMTPGDELRVVLSEAAAPEGEGDAIAYLLIGVAIVAAIAAAAFFLLGRRRSREAPRGGPKKARPAQPQRARASGARGSQPTKTRPSNGHRPARPRLTAEIRDDDEEVQLLIDEIAALDLSFEKELIDERTYRRLRVAAKDRLLEARDTARSSR